MSEEEILKSKLKVSAILFSYNVPVEEAKIIGTFIEELQQENSQLKEDIKGLQCERQTLYNTIHDLKKANKQLNIKIDRGINKIEKAQKIIEVPTYPENIYLMRE